MRSKYLTPCWARIKCSENGNFLTHHFADLEKLYYWTDVDFDSDVRNSTDRFGPAHLSHNQFCFLSSHLPPGLVFQLKVSSTSDIVPSPFWLGFSVNPSKIFLWLGQFLPSSAWGLLGYFYELLLCSKIKCHVCLSGFGGKSSRPVPP